MNRNLFLVLFLSVFMVGCKTRKFTSIAYNPTVEKSKSLQPQILCEDIRRENIHFKSLSVNGSIDINLNGSENSATFHLRMKSDSLIWMSIRGPLGVEVIRALITPDSVRLVDRINHQALLKPLQYLQKYTGTPLSFGMLQDILLANFNTLSQLDFSLRQDSTFYLLEADTNRIAYKIWITPGFNRLSHMRASLNQENKILEVFYPFFQDLNGKQALKAENPNSLFPRIVTATFSDIGKSAISIEYGRFKFEDHQDYPFSVSKRYSLVE